MDTIEKFFSKKRELSSKSNDGDAPKKPKFISYF